MLISELKEIIAYKHCTKAVAVSLRGKLLHVARSCGGKSGRFSLCNLGDIANGLVLEWSDPLALEMVFSSRI